MSRINSHLDRVRKRRRKNSGDGETETAEFKDNDVVLLCEGLFMESEGQSPKTQSTSCWSRIGDQVGARILHELKTPGIVVWHDR